MTIAGPRNIGENMDLRTCASQSLRLQRRLQQDHKSGVGSGTYKKYVSQTHRSLAAFALATQLSIALLRRET